MMMYRVPIDPNAAILRFTFLCTDQAMVKCTIPSTGNDGESKTSFKPNVIILTILCVQENNTFEYFNTVRI